MRNTFSPRSILLSIKKPIERFIHAETSSGILLLICGIAALALANSALHNDYHHVWETPCSISIGSISMTKALHHWINDGLMVIFFFVVGLEIKRELLVGELSSAKKAALPVVAALGGMVAPALIYMIFNGGTPAERGWGIPMATDIAFALGVVALLGSRVPFVLKVFLAALAIADDLGAVLVIALFYTEEIQGMMLFWASVAFVVALVGNILGVRSVLFYLIVGVVLWIVILQSGIHATIAGVLLAVAIPARQRINADEFAEHARAYIEEFAMQTRESKSILANQRAQSAVRDLERSCELVQTPLSRFENNLHAWVAFLIMPIFAIANAGVRLEGNLAEVFLHPITLGIIGGLVLGKPLGITLFCWIACRLKIAHMPVGVTWVDIIGIGSIAGIGFTMALFIQGLAFTDATLAMEAKVGIFAASLISGILGYCIFSLRSRRRGVAE
ncbi:MAG: Na+/H+ antiporter NhaA [Bacteroidota bacterium]|nr:Na+/H+ antiporter NhaA [Candidatus Kapabacteria bacterium]MDW8219923.1 Na+/H+ antiporter NhaA [Bacteroidota bacterium]